jgi:glycosyltransferase involved in cell wall biosynthesis
MSIAFLLPTPPPVRPQAEAYAQEIAILCARFDGETLCINPNPLIPEGIGLQIPRPFFGFHQPLALRQLGARNRIFHCYSPTLYPYPVLATLSRPVVYSLTGGYTAERDDPAFFNGLAAVTVPDPESRERLLASGLENVHVVQSGIDADRFDVHALEIGDHVHLLMASAPWTLAQFADKGIDAMLAAVAAEPRLRVTFLWRGVLTETMRERVRRADVADRVAVIDEMVDVGEALAGVHAGVNLATDGGIVKAYPHSLLEALAAGKPVIVSRQIPMATYVGSRGVGVVVDEITSSAILDAVARLESEYDQLSESARKNRCGDFTIEGMVDSYRKVYASIDPGFAEGEIMDSGEKCG